MTDYSLALMSGVDIPIPECQIAVHQPTLKEISLIGEKAFYIGAQTICINKSMVVKDKSGLENTSNFQIFMTIMSDQAEVDKKQSVKQLLQIVFPNTQTIFTPQSIIINVKNQESVIIDEKNFECLQDILKKVFCLSSGEQDTFNPANEKAKEIVEKLMRGRARIAAERSSEGSALIQYTSVLAVGLQSMSLQEIFMLTLYQFYDLIQRYTLFVNWDLDVRTRLAGGKPDSQPDNWMKNIH